MRLSAQRRFPIPWHFLALAALFYVPQTFAQTGPQNLNVSGVLYLPSGSPVTQSNVNFRLEIWDKDSTCVLYSEEHLAQDLSQSKGGFALPVGRGTSPANYLESSASFTSKLFENTGAVAGGWANCASGTTLAPGDERVIRVHYDLGGGFIAMSPDVPVASSAYAMVADTLQGKSPSDLVQVRDDATYDLSQANVENVFSSTNYARLQQLLNPSAAIGFGSQRLTNLADPTSAQDAATKNYTDSKLAGQAIDLVDVAPGFGGGKVLTWDSAANKWVAQAPSIAGSAGGDLTGSYPNPTIAALAIGTSKLADDAVTSAKINSTGIATNRLLMTDGTTGATVTYANCANNEILKYVTGTGWQCATVASLSAVTSVAGKSGAVTLNAADIGGLGTAAVRDIGVAATEIPELDAGGKLAASTIPLFAGDVTGAIGANIVTQLQGREVASTLPNLNEVLRWNGSRWEPQALTDNVGITALNGDVTAAGTGLVSATINNGAITTPKMFATPGANRLVATDATTGATLTPFTCSLNETMQWTAGGWACATAAALIGDAYIVDGGNARGGDIRIGTSDNYGLHLQTNSVARVSIGNTGNVGIGTTAPSARFSVGAGTDTDSAYFFYDNAQVPLTTDGQSLYVYRRASAGDTYLRLYNHQSGWGSVISSNSSLYIQPTSFLYLRPTGGAIYFEGTTNTGASWSGAGSNPAANHYGYITAAGAQKYVQWKVNDATDNFELQRQDTSIGNLDVQMPALFTGGNVGIGTTSPSAKLSVAGSNADSAYFFYDNANVGDTTDGQSLYVYRRAAEGNGYFRAYVDQYNNATLTNGGGGLNINSGGGSLYLNNGNWSSVIVGPGGMSLGASWSGPSMNPPLTQWGYITAVGASRWVSWKVNDATDNYELTRQDTNIGMMDVQIPAAFTGGNVGIGTTSPARKLDVAGSLRLLPAALPSAPAAGDLAFDSAAGNTLKFHNGTSWQTIGTSSATGDFMADGSVAMTGQLRSIAGTQAAPGFTFTGDTDTGIFSPAADTIALGTSAAEKLRVTDAGLIGIGTTNPTMRLHISSAANNSSDAWIHASNSADASSSSAGLSVQSGTSDAASGYMAAFSNSYNNSAGPFADRLVMTTNSDASGITLAARGASQDLRFLTGGTSERMRILASGYVGIGITNPSVPLEVAGATKLGGILTVTNSTAAVFGDSGTNFVLRRNVDDNRLILAGGTSASSGGNISLYGGSHSTSPNLISFWNGTTEAMRISGSGYLGIGTTAPSRPLHVAGPVRFDPSAPPASPAAGDLIFDSGASNALKYHNGSSWVSVGSGSGDFMKNGSVAMTGNLRLNNNWLSGDGGSEGIFVDSSGNVGIGTTASTTPLEIRSDGTAVTGVNQLVLHNESAAGPGVGSAIKFVGNGDSPMGRVQLGWDGANTANSTLALQNVRGGTLTNVFVANYLGSVALGGSTALNVGFDVTAGMYQGTAGAGYGTRLQQTIKAGADNDALTALYVNPTFNDNAKASVSHNGLIVTSGNVGIGTTAPTAQLEVYGPGNTANGIIKASDNADADFAALDSNQGLILSRTAAYVNNSKLGGSLALRTSVATTNDTIGLSVANNGNIGIGNTAPQRRLHLSGSLRVDPSALPGSPAAGDIAIDSGASNALKYYNGSTWVTTAGGGSTPWSTTGSDIYYNTGKVGIGHVTPLTTLHTVSSDALWGGTIFENTNSSSVATFSTLTNARRADSVGAGVGVSLMMNDSNGDLAEYGYYGALIEDNTANSQNGSIAFYPRRANVRTEAMRLTSAGKVGIGTSTPGSELDVNGSINATDDYWINGASVLTAYGGRVVAGDVGSNNLAVAINANNAERVRVNSTGVGIGTTSPGRLLQVAGAMRLSPTALPGSPAAGDIAIDSGASNALKYHNGTSWISLGAGSGDFMKDGSVAMTGNLRLNNNWLSGDGGYEGMFVASSGNVGIGTSSPTSPLHVESSADDDQTLEIKNSNTTGTSVAAEVEFSNGGWTGWVGLGGMSLWDPMYANRTYLHNYGPNGISIVADAPGGNTPDIRLYTGAGTVDERMRIDTNGKVGIGTTNPQSPLHVEGNGQFGSTGAVTIVGGGMLAGEKGLTVRYSSLYDAGSIQAEWQGVTYMPLLLNKAGGNVGIGTTAPGEKLEVNGNVLASSYLHSSDRRLKKDIRTIEGLDLIRLLRGVRFKWKSNDVEEMGFIAQEVEEVAPELVNTNPETGYKSVKYSSLTSPLVEAVKDLDNMCRAHQQRIDELNSRVQRLESENDALKKRLERLEEAVLRKPASSP